MRCRHDVCKFLVEAMHNAQIGKLSKSAEDILIEVSQVLGFPDVKTFLSVRQHFIIICCPIFVPVLDSTPLVFLCHK
jgi:hypothetical protein